MKISSSIKRLCSQDRFYDIDKRKASISNIKNSGNGVIPDPIGY